MSESKHTPGPWFVFNNGHCVGGMFVPAEEDDPAQTTAGVAMCGMRLRRPDEAEANARLIAACPDLLATLVALVEMKESPLSLPLKDQRARWDAARAAIAKAEGGAK